MILVDLNQVMISSVMAQLKRFDGKPDENLIRHMILSSIKYYNRNFKSKYGNMVICCDNKAYWRKSIFPQYKAGRRQERDGDTIDWSVIYETLNKIKSEIKENLGYHVIEVDNAEADDIIGTLCKYVRDEPILILSSDKDFMQLQKYDNVEQFSPNAKKFVQADNPIKYIREQVIRGDRGDGIPNVFSPDDTFTEKRRQKSITKLDLERWVKEEGMPNDFLKDEEAIKGYKRNLQLINLDYIPEKYENAILEQYENKPKHKTKMQILDYFIRMNLRDLPKFIEDF